MSLEHARDLLHGIESRSDGQPYQCETKRRTAARLPKRPQHTQRFLDSSRASDFEMQRLQGREGARVMVGPTFVAEKPQVFGAGQRRVFASAQKGAMLLLPYGVHRLGHLAHDVEAIAHDLPVAVGQAIARGGDVRLPNIARTPLSWASWLQYSPWRTSD
jgi:hypothetical protein